MNQNIDKLFHINETLDEKVDIVEQERTSFLMRTENLALEVKRYKDEMILMKEQIYQYIEQSHLELK